MKRTKVYWTMSPIIDMPSAIYDNPTNYNSLAPCPVVGEHARRTRLLTAPYDMKIQPVFRYNQVTEENEFIQFEASSNDLVDENIWSRNTLVVTNSELWYNNNYPQFQLVMPYVFVSEEDIDMSLIGLQNVETKSKLNNLQFIEATMPIGKMARPLSSAWAFTNKEEAHIIKGEPLMKLVFSKPVELVYFTPGPLFTHWSRVNNGIVNYQRHGTKKKFPIILQRKPKRLFKEIKNNIEYSEA